MLKQDLNAQTKQDDAEIDQLEASIAKPTEDTTEGSCEEALCVHIDLYVEKVKEKNVTDLRVGALCEQTNGSVRRRSDPGHDRRSTECV